MIRLEDLPQELRDAIFIQDCHVSGMHDPSHTHKYVCDIQLRDMAHRILNVLGIDLSKKDRAKLIIEWNKIPRRLERPGWYDYYREGKIYQDKADALIRWEQDGIDGQT
jgi:hypothetical protein